MSDEHLNIILSNTFDCGIMVAETGNRNHPLYEKKREDLKRCLIGTQKKAIRTVIKLEGVHHV